MRNLSTRTILINRKTALIKQLIFTEALIFLTGFIIIISVLLDYSQPTVYCETLVATKLKKTYIVETVTKHIDENNYKPVAEVNELDSEVIDAIDMEPKFIYLHFETIFTKEWLENLSSSDKEIVLSSRDWIPTLNEERISTKDIQINLDQVLITNTEYVYYPSDEVERLWALMVEREAANQSFLGKLAVAEDIRNRIFDGSYGNDLIKILQNGYGGLKYENETWHVYCKDREITVISEETIEAIELAKSGSNFSSKILQIVTERWQQENWNIFGEEFYAHGAIYHYNPDCVTEDKLKDRNFNRVPISFKIDDHVFYGYWLPEGEALFL